MEWKIGEIRQVNGEWYQCVKSDGTCNGCIGKFQPYSFCNDFKECVGKIFKKLEKIGEPYHNSEKKLCQQYKCYINPLVTDEIVYVFADNKVVIETKQTKEDMEEKKQKLDDLVGLYSSGKITYKEFEKGIRELYEKRSNSEKIGKNLKAFDLQKAKDGKPVFTRDGRKARIICFDRRADNNIVALIEDEGREVVRSYYNDGKYLSFGEEAPLDLMKLPEKKEGYANIVKEALSDDRVVLGRIFDSYEDAFRSGKANERYVATIKIQWEE